MQNTPSNELYNLLVTKNFEPEILDINGKAVSSPNDAEMFSFDWKVADTNYGTVVALLGRDQDLQLYYSENISKELGASDRKQWYDFLKQMKNFAVRNMLTFDLKNLSRLKYTMQSMSAIREGLSEGYYGNKKTSYSDLPKHTRLVIKHSKPLGEGEARYRFIESLFIETDAGERFKLPFTKLVGGKAMARHIAEGGTPYDEFGKHITEIIKEMDVMSRFARTVKNKSFDNETEKLVAEALKHYNYLKAKAKRMISQRGYIAERENFSPEAVDVDDNMLENVKNMFIEQNLDSRIEAALPTLARLQGKTMKEATEFEAWANKLVEGNWALPDTPRAKEKLNQLLAQELPVGPDAINATEQLYDIFGDDDLFDKLSDLASHAPDADARPLIIKRMKELGLEVPEINSNSMGEDLDTDGVMSTRPSNMSSESIERLKFLSALK